LLNLHIYWAMARPMQLVAVMLVATTGALMSHISTAYFDALQLVWALFAIVPIAISIHYVNEYSDFETDRLTKQTPYSGGSGALVKHPELRPRLPLIAALFFISGILVTWMAQLGLLSICVLLMGGFFGWMYSRPPLKLAWRGWGELTNALLGGFLLIVYGYVIQIGQIDWVVILLSVPFTLLVFINLLATTWADRKADHMVGKLTLATRCPVRYLRLLYVTVALLAVVAWIIFVDSALSPPWLLFGVPTIPFLIWGTRRYTRIHSPHPTVFAMATLMFSQAIMWSIVCLVVYL